MLKKTPNLFSIAIFFVLILLLLELWIGVAKAQTLSSLKGRVSRLESANARLSNRLSRLESQVKRGRSPNSLANREPISPPSPSPAPSIDDPMFDRLATLVIELKERINALEARVEALE